MTHYANVRKALMKEGKFLKLKQKNKIYKKNIQTSRKFILMKKNPYTVSRDRVLVAVSTSARARVGARVSRDCLDSEAVRLRSGRER